MMILIYSLQKLDKPIIWLCVEDKTIQVSTIVYLDCLLKDFGTNLESNIRAIGIAYQNQAELNRDFNESLSSLASPAAACGGSIVTGVGSHHLLHHANCSIMAKLSAKIGLNAAKAACGAVKIASIGVLSIAALILCSVIEETVFAHAQMIENLEENKRNAAENAAAGILHFTHIHEVRATC